MIKILLSVFTCFIFEITAVAHDKTKIIIDTDGGADDLRAISLIFSTGKYEVAAITTSDGVLAPETSLQKVRSLLCTLHHEGIPVAAGRTTVSDPCLCRKLNENIIWGNECSDIVHCSLSAPNLINTILAASNEKVLIFCFGSLTNICDALNAARQNEKKVGSILWYNESISPASGFNFESDSLSANKVLSGNLPLSAINNNSISPVIFDEDFLNMYGTSKTLSGNIVYTALSTKEVRQVIRSGHFRLWDELLPLYLQAPQFFDTLTSKGNMYEIELKNHLLETTFQQCLSEMLQGDEPKNIVLKNFPTETMMYASDVAQIADSVIHLYGKNEFRAAVLTSELHGHLGVYSIFGVKMGIRAMEYFNCGIDELRITSHGGNIPPVSCLNDGLQVSTGATLGHGLISVNPEGNSVAADFHHDTTTIRMSLKNEIAVQIQNNIAKIISETGLFTDEYWHQIRILAIRYWLESDRNKIFEITPLN